MKKKILALACGTSLLVGFTSGCPCGYGSSTKAGMNRMVNAQPAVTQVVVAPSKAVRL